MINLEDEYLKILKNILSKYEYKFYIFGSRVTPYIKPFSDIDIVYFDPIPISDVVKLEEEFENSDLPYTVDLIDFNQCDEEFQNTIKKNHIAI